MNESAHIIFRSRLCSLELFMQFQKLLKHNTKNQNLQKRIQSIDAVLNDMKGKLKSSKLSYADLKQSCTEYQAAKKCLLTQKFSAWFVSLIVSHNIRITKSQDYEQFKLDF